MIQVLHLRSSSGAGGGPEKTIFKTGELIDRHRFGYHVIYLHKKGVPVDPLSKKGDFAYVEMPGGPVIDIPQLARISRYIRKNNIRILHSHEPKTDFYAYLLHLLHPGTLTISTIHGWIIRRLRSRLHFMFDLFLLRRFSRVITVSSPTTRLAREKGLKNCVLIHNAIDTEEWGPSLAPPPGAPQVPSGSFTVGFCGRLSAEKGPMEFIAVAERMLRGGKPCRLLVAGEGPLMGAVKDRVALSSNPAAYVFAGHLSGDKMMEFYRQIDVLLSPSHTEGLPNSLLEAMAMKVPVVATRVGGVEDLIPDPSKGLLSERGDIDSLFHHLSRLRDDLELRGQIAEEARRHIERSFSFHVRVRKIEDLYEEAAGGPEEAPGAFRR